MNKVIIAVVLIVIILGVGGYWWMNKSKMGMEGSMSPSPEAMMSPSDNMMPASPSSDSAMMGAVKEFTLTNQGLKFDQSEIKVNKGDKVKITFKDAMGGHDLKIDEFKVGTKMLKAGEQDSVEFTADKAGTFQYYCSVPGHKQAGMWGNLIVQ